MRRAIFALMLACGIITSAPAQVSVSIGINMPVYPQLVRVPSYPVYYAPGLSANYFFYDGMYWVYQSDNWYASSWYNGPWAFIGPESVPLFVLRVPVRYYRQPPVYFRGWRSDAPPRWGEHWGRGWEQQRSGWDRWNRGAAPAPAPLPAYQRQYGGKRYPAAEQQRALQNQNYRYQPRDAAVRQRVQQAAPPPPHEQRPEQRPVPHADAPGLPARGGSTMARPAPPGREHADARRPAEAAERVVPQPRAAPPAPHQGAARPERGQGQGQEHDRGEGRGQDKKN